MTWREVLEPYRAGRLPLFDDAFLARWGGLPWRPSDDDRTAAAKVHTQLVSRIATQPLGYLEGDEKTALRSVYALFQKARDLADAHPKCQHFDALTWHVLNVHVRPFTAKWHPLSERGALAALDATDDFRADLDRLRPLLQQFDRLLLHIRDDAPAPPAIDAGDREDDIAAEMREELAWAIRAKFSGFRDAGQVDAINKAERDAIAKRREHYKLKHTTHAAGLAISGGGIRSATFSLGVLVSLAQRGLLPQFDYLSTVSGGGYLGSFLSVFLQSLAPNVGLCGSELPFKREEGEAAALRHIRHHGKYLAAGSMWERIKTISAQLLGMALNGLAIVWLMALAAALESQIRASVMLDWPAIFRWLLWGLAAGAVLSLVALRSGGALRRHADWFVAAPAALLALFTAAELVGRLHTWYASPPEPRSWSFGSKEVWVAVAGAVPVLGPAITAAFPRLLKRFRILLAALSAITAPLFLIGLYLVLYENGSWLIASHAFGVRVPPVVLVFAAGLVVYLFVFDVNSTSPHRHYRHKLAEAYLIQPRGGSEISFRKDVSIRLSTLGTHTSKAPYHLINCALNVPASRDAAMQGRLTDFFLFSPEFTGSPLIGYSPTRAWEALDLRLDIGTAMAISGAAAAPQMGLATVKRFTFWLALLNVRLGYWVRQPGVRSTLRAPGLGYLLKEMIGSMDENGPWIHVSDGGHIENLGVYELLRRRCKYIVAIDGEEDAKMTFRGLTTLQRLAAIDLGVSIDIDLEDLRVNDAGLSRSHFRFCRIRYPKEKRGSEEELGYLLYVKLSLTGNEGEFIRRFRLEEPAFPHHTTADQFFSEAQFEAYRSLGEHVGNKLFLRAIVGDLADRGEVDLEQWFHALGTSLLEPITGLRRQ